MLLPSTQNPEETVAFITNESVDDESVNGRISLSCW
jgi:hypothetical protein